MLKYKFFFSQEFFLYICVNLIKNEKGVKYFFLSVLTKKAIIITLTKIETLAAEGFI